MPAVLDRPTVSSPIVDNIFDTDQDMQPVWVLLVHETATQSWLEIGDVLLKIMPELNRDKINYICTEIKQKQCGVVFKGEKPLVERYYERLKRNDLHVTMERE